MFFPFSLQSASNWLDFVPNFLLTLPNDSKYVNNKEFHHYLASTFETFFPQTPSRFLSTILTILKEATEAGKYVILETLLLAGAIWEELTQYEKIQPVLTELALSTDKLYSKSAVNLSSKLEDIPLLHEEETIEEAMDEKEEVAAFDEAVLDDILEGALEEITSEKLKSEAPPEIAEPAPPPTPPPKPVLRTPSGPSGGVSPVSRPAARAAPPAPQPAPPPPPSEAPPPAPTAAPIKAAESFDIREEEVSKKRKKVIKEELKTEIEEKPIPPTTVSPETIKPETIHTHVHYYSRMNPRKTYPFTVTLSQIAKKIAADKKHFLSGEEEKETRGEFELLDITKRIVVEPLLGGCLVQPTSQIIDPKPQNLPKVLTFFITPLVEAGFRATSLEGSLFIKDERETVLLRLDLPELSVASHRVSQVAALIGIIGGGTMPAVDSLFNGTLQATMAGQLAILLPQLARSFDMIWVIIIAQVLLFVGAVGGAILWWWKKGRAKIVKVAPERTMTLQLTQ
ncbi:MAG: hypothetical protein JSU57_05405 [Candidatus Heimdallarchaeota archaeon]|nr:MAG: hypothetical protein JSU57_05405 [Candidatus Heimdallarchaeota archaeon]